MRAFAALIMLSALLVACSSSDDGGDGSNGQLDDQNVMSTESSESGETLADDESSGATVTGASSDDVSANENGGVTGSADGEGVTIEIDNSDDLSDETVTDGLLQARQAIVGVWELLDPASQCLDTLSFDGERQFVATSLDEIRSGTYRVYLDGDDDSTLMLDLSFDEDNQLPDCSGDNSSSAGVLFDIYLSFPSVDVMRLSESPGGFGNFVEFVRQN